jgi:hypothetical protein
MGIRPQATPRVKTYQLRIQLWSGTVLTADIPGDQETADRWRMTVSHCPDVASVAVVELVEDEDGGEGPDPAA